MKEGELIGQGRFKRFYYAVHNGQPAAYSEYSSFLPPHHPYPHLVNSYEDGLWEYLVPIPDYDETTLNPSLIRWGHSTTCRWT